MVHAHAETVKLGENPESLNMSKNTAEKIQDLINRQKLEGYGLKIQVLPGGCSGFSYDFTFLKEPEAGDNVLEFSGLKIFIDKTSLAMMKGATIDYSEGLQGGGVQVINPNARSTCGCGKSFG